MLPNTLISTKVLLDAYTELREQLCGECSESICPKDIVNWVYGYALCLTRGKSEENRVFSFCLFCRDSWQVNRYKFIWDEECPCQSDLTSEQIFTRLDEVIAELQIKLKKEYSS